MHTLISPRSDVPSPVLFGTPPNSISSTPLLTSSLPCIVGNKELMRFVYRALSWLILYIVFHSAGDIRSLISCGDASSPLPVSPLSLVAPLFDDYNEKRIDQA